MSRVAELNRRIKAKLEELDQDREERDNARQRVHRLDLRVDEIDHELVKVRRRLRNRRGVLREIQADLDEWNARTPEKETPEEVELRERLDQLAGEIDEAIAVRDRFLETLDHLKAKRSDARAVLENALKESEEDREAIKRLRARRKRIQERQDKPSPNFSYAEFDCNDGTPLPEQSEPAVRHWCHTVGEPLREKFGSVHINSGFRHRAYNARIGGEDNSVHIYDFPGRDYKAVAVDFTCEEGTPKDWYAFTLGKADGRGLYATFHHADTRNRIGWPDATWSG